MTMIALFYGLPFFPIAAFLKYIITFVRHYCIFCCYCKCCDKTLKEADLPLNYSSSDQEALTS